MAWLAVVLTINVTEIVMHNSAMRTVEWCYVERAVYENVNRLL